MLLYQYWNRKLNAFTFSYIWFFSMLSWESNSGAKLQITHFGWRAGGMCYCKNIYHGYKRKNFLVGAPICASPGILMSENFGVSRANYWMINRKCDCENEVSCEKFAFLRNSNFWKSVSCQNYSYLEQLANVKN